MLFVSAEVAPYSKTGGLGDVAGALPAALRGLGHEVLTVTPRYGHIDPGELRPEPRLANVALDLGMRRLRWSGLSDPATGVLFVEIPELYLRGALYTEDDDEHLRFAALSMAALEACRALGWRPDVIHANDWHTGLVPSLVQGPYAQDRVVGGAPTVLTIHNLGYQGRFPARVLPEVGLYGYSHLLDGTASDHLGFLETGILLADLVTTVSPTYAAEIRTPEGGAGLDGLLRSRGDDLVGILNGIDTTEWNPRTDRLIPFRYSAKSLWRKERDKEALLTERGLPYRKDVPVVGVVSRLVTQKGFDIAREPLSHFLDSWDVRLVVLGSGEAALEAMFAELAERWPHKAAFVAGYDHRLSHLIEAGADIFLMPSRYEPCGLNQMYSLAYGTVPVVHRTGGLVDTVRPVDPDTGEGTGFGFDHHTPDGLGWALGQALTLHIDRRRWRQVQARGMAEDNSWERRAGEYVAAYRRVMAASGRQG